MRKTPLMPDRYYHIYNRGINGQTIFLEERNYTYFLQKYAQYMHPFTDTFAYCLLNNHFHFLIRTKSEEEIRTFINSKQRSLRATASKPSEKSVSWHLSNAFASLFKSYAQAINKHNRRTGGLFEEPFHRIEVTNEAYFSWLVWYIHFNPQKHGFVDDYRDYLHSSYHSLLLEKNTKLNKKEVIDWFGDKEGYLKFHDIQHAGIAERETFIIEFDLLFIDVFA